MSWLSSAINDVGKLWNNDIRPALSNPIVDIGLGLGATALTGGLLAPEIASAFGLGGEAAGASTLGGIDAITTGAGVDAAAAAPTALGFAADVSPLGGDLSSFLANPLSVPGGSDIPNLALASGVSGPTPAAGLPSLGSSVSAAPGFSSSASGLGDFLGGSGFDPSTWAGNAASPTSAFADSGLGTYEGNINTIANPSFGSPGVNPLAPTTATVGGSQPGQIANLVSSATGGLISPTTASTIGSIAGPAAGIGGLGYNLYQGYEQKKQLQQLQQQEQQQSQQAQQTAQQEQAAAAPLLSQGNTLISYLTNGTLPQSFQSQVDQTIAGAKAQIIQGYASRGMSSDPSQNSALAQDLANVDTQANSLKANLEQTLATSGNQLLQQANSLLQSGMSATQLSSQIPILVQQLTSQLNQSTSQAISNFASAFGNAGSGGQKVTLNLAA